MRHLNRHCPLCGVSVKQLTDKVRELDEENTSKSRLIEHLYQRLDDSMRRPVKWKENKQSDRR